MKLITFSDLKIGDNVYHAFDNESSFDNIKKMTVTQLSKVYNPSKQILSLNVNESTSLFSIYLKEDSDKTKAKNKYGNWVFFNFSDAVLHVINNIRVRININTENIKDISDENAKMIKRLSDKLCFVNDFHEMGDRLLTKREYPYVKDIYPSGSNTVLKLHNGSLLTIDEESLKIKYPGGNIDAIDLIK